MNELRAWDRAYDTRIHDYYKTSPLLGGVTSVFSLVIRAAMRDPHQSTSEPMTKTLPFPLQCGESRVPLELAQRL